MSAAARPILLVVDNEPDTLVQALHSQPWQVETLRNASKTLATARRMSPALVLLGAHLPDVDSFALCRKLKAEHAGRFMPVVLTNTQFDTDGEAGIEAGADDLLPARPLVAEVVARVRLMLRHIVMQQDIQAQHSAEAEDSWLQYLENVLHNFADEVRTPLLMAKTPVALLLKSYREQGLPIPSNIEISLQALGRLDDIVDEMDGLLSLPKKPDLAPFVLTDAGDAIVRWVSRRWTRKADQQRLKIRVENCPLLFGDRRKIEQILRALVDNALKFSKSDDVWLHAQAEGEFVWVSVRDHGIGLTDQQIALLGKPFWQADMGTTRRYKGLGLGLTFVQRAVVQLDLLLHVASAPGKGTTVSLRVPIYQSGMKF